MNANPAAARKLAEHKAKQPREKTVKLTVENLLPRTEVELAFGDGHDDLAYVRGTYTMTLQPEGAPNAIEDTGKFLDIRKKQPDGSWVWTVDMYSSDNKIT